MPERAGGHGMSCDVLVADLTGSFGTAQLLLIVTGIDATTSPSASTLRVTSA